MFKKSRLKNATGIDTSKLPAKYDLVSLKAEIDKLGIVKLVPVPVNWSKLSDVVKHNVAKKIMYDKLVTNLSNIDISRFVLKSKHDTDKSGLEKKCLILTGLLEN